MKCDPCPSAIKLSSVALLATGLIFSAVQSRAEDGAGPGPFRAPSVPLVTYNPFLSI